MVISRMTISEEELSQFINDGSTQVIASALKEEIITEEQAEKMKFLQVVAHKNEKSIFSQWLHRLICKGLKDNYTRFTVIKVINAPEND